MRGGARVARRGVLVAFVLLLAVALLPAGSVAVGATGAGSISGRITDFDTGLGVLGARVEIYCASPHIERSTVTGVGGTYRFDGLATVTGAKTRYTVSVSGVPGTESQYYRWENGARVPAPGAEPLGDYTYVDLAYLQNITGADLAGMRGGAVIGTVTFADDPAPMYPCVVRATSTTDPDVTYSGRFEWGEPYSLAVPAGSYEVTFTSGLDFILDSWLAVASNGVRAEPLLAPMAAVPAVVTTGAAITANGAVAYNPNTARFAGRVLGPDGLPVSGAQVEAFYLSPDEGWQPVAGAAVDTDADGTPDVMPMTAMATTGDDGRFVVQLLGGSSYRFSVELSPYSKDSAGRLSDAASQYYPHAAELADASDLTLSKGQTAGGDWTLAHGTTLSGTLSDQLGHSVLSGWGSNATAAAERLSAASGEWEQVSYDYTPSKAYAIRHLPAGTYRVRFRGTWSLSEFYYGQTATTPFATITVGAVSEPTTITLAASAFPGKCYSDVYVTPFWPTVRRHSTVRMTASVKVGLLVIKGATLKIYRSYNNGRSWTYLKTVRTSSTTGKYVYSFRPSRSAKYKFKYAGTSKIRSDEFWNILSVK